MPLSQTLSPLSFRASLAEAARFWEPRRIAYNLVLAVIAALWVLLSWPHFRPVFHFSSLPLLLVLALLANACYGAAYFVDIPAQFTPFCSAWPHFRWGLWVLGTLLAVLFENYWIADEIYPFIR